MNHHQNISLRSFQLTQNDLIFESVFTRTKPSRESIRFRECVAKAQKHREETNVVIDGLLFDEVGRDITGRTAKPYHTGSPIRFAPHLKDVSEIVVKAKAQRRAPQSWVNPNRTLDDMRAKLIEALESLVGEFDCKAYPESKTANTVDILAHSILNIDDYFNQMEVA